MRQAKAVALGVRFLLELCILVSLAAWSLSRPLEMALRIVIGGTVCIAAALIWGAILSPRRRIDFPAPARLAIEAAFFAVAAAALAQIGSTTLALMLVICAIADRIALAVLR